MSADELRELRGEGESARWRRLGEAYNEGLAAGTHIVEGELRDVDHTELIRELREAGWIDAPYLDVRGGVVREVEALPDVPDREDIDRVRDELAELLAASPPPSPRGTHIVRAELRDCGAEEFVAGLRAMGWRPAPYLAVDGGRVREVTPPQPD